MNTQERKKFYTIAEILREITKKTQPDITQLPVQSEAVQPPVQSEVERVVKLLAENVIVNVKPVAVVKSQSSRNGITAEQLSHISMRSGGVILPEGGRTFIGHQVIEEKKLIKKPEHKEAKKEEKEESEFSYEDARPNNI